MKKIFTLFAAIALAAVSYAQLPSGAIAPDFTVYEIDKTNGNMITDQPIHLYGILDQGKTVFLDISATWCGPCYSFHQSGTLDGIWSNYGPHSSNYDSYVIWMEGDRGNYSSLTGGTDAGGSASQGNWLNGVEYPIVPLNMDPNTPNKNTIISGYNLAYYPTIYMICPNRMTFEMDRSGGNDATTWHNLIASTCPATNNTNDAMLGSGRSSALTYYCDYSFAPVVTLQNLGTAPLTSATLRMTCGSQVEEVNWTGNLAQFETAQVTMPTINGTENGSVTFTVEIVNVNGVADEGSDFNTHSETFLSQLSSTTANASQDFAAENLTPWALDDQTDGGCFVYQGALVFNSYSVSNGGKANLFSPLLNFANVTSPELTFDLCYKRYNDNSNDKLQIMVSTDCGDHWTTIFNKSGSALATGANTTSNYVAGADEYVNQTIDLSDFISNDKVIVKFAFTSAYGNNIWVDNINVTGVQSIEEEDMTISIYPNPATDVVSINSEKAINQIDVYDANGRLVTTYTNVNNTINVKNLANGIYMLNVVTEEGIIVKKIVKE